LNLDLSSTPGSELENEEKEMITPLFLASPETLMRIPRHCLANRYLTSAGMDVASGLLTMDPTRRLSATQALSMPYFTEHPTPELPSQWVTSGPPNILHSNYPALWENPLLSLSIAEIQGEWHEMEAKQERARKRHRDSIVKNDQTGVAMVGEGDLPWWEDLGRFTEVEETMCLVCLLFFFLNPCVIQKVGIIDGMTLIPLFYYVRRYLLSAAFNQNTSKSRDPLMKTRRDEKVV
jgi:hypothetical protein